MKKLSHSIAIIGCALSSAYFVGCGSDADSDNNNTAGSGGEAGNSSGDAGSNSNAGSGGSSGSGGTVNNGGGGSANGGSSGGGAANGGSGGSLGGSGGTGGDGGSDVGGAGGDNQGGGGAGGSGGQGNPPSADCEELCLGNADSDSIFTMCPQFNYFGGSEATCLSECAANEAAVWDMGCRIMHLETIYNQQSVNDAVHCPHVNGAAPCSNRQ